jgi:hypothetical protein
MPRIASSHNRHNGQFIIRESLIDCAHANAKQLRGLRLLYSIPNRIQHAMAKIFLRFGRKFSNVSFRIHPALNALLTMLMHWLVHTVLSVQCSELLPLGEDRGELSGLVIGKQLFQVVAPLSVVL